MKSASEGKKRRSNWQANERKKTGRRNRKLSKKMAERVNLAYTLEELLNFTLQSFVNGTLELDLGLPKDFCSQLLQPEPEPEPEPNDDLFPPSLSDTTDCFQGIPPYPLYKRLALALHESIISGTFLGTRHNMASDVQESSLKEEKNGWQKLISEKGSELFNMLRAVDFELHVQEPFFSQLKDGLKTIEGRCAIGDYCRFLGDTQPLSRVRPFHAWVDAVVSYSLFWLSCLLYDEGCGSRTAVPSALIVSGSLILFNKCILIEVQDVRSYSLFSDMMEAEGLSKVLPGVETIEQGVQVYRKFYTEEKEMSNGVLAISVSKLPLQPCDLLAGMLFGLNKGGLQGLLGLAHTTGTIPEALPPPKSTLLSSFMLPYKLNVEHSTLTHGARALAKHAERSSSKYWGTIDGNDSNKNRLALDVISRLMTHCCWLNVHIVQPHGAIFEIRVAEGYGARWSSDGSKTRLCVLKYNSLIPVLMKAIEICPVTAPAVGIIHIISQNHSPFPISCNDQMLLSSYSSFGCAFKMIDNSKARSI
ncbi:hypothetical protein DVH24_001062 [Malus domestica]|uniref:ASCH domain-containing protein n=1 Tax=Malus domestica TaxID=3750 RepID=A0A498K0L3_MALDO|nr:hypothetical protein DVH24_001062 [Malus domestica]